MQDYDDRQYPSHERGKLQKTALMLEMLGAGYQKSSRIRRMFDEQGPAR